MTTATDLSLLLRCYDRTPGDWTLVAALADAFAEAGDEDFAEGCRWVLEKKRRPWQKVETDADIPKHHSSYDAGWSNYSDGDRPSLKPSLLPASMSAAYWRQKRSTCWAADGNTANSELLLRLLAAWRTATVAERTSAWHWSPSQ